jgi:hypothetical protein
MNKMLISMMFCAVLSTGCSKKVSQVAGYNITQDNLDFSTGVLEDLNTSVVYDASYDKVTISANLDNLPEALSFKGIRIGTILKQGAGNQNVGTRICSALGFTRPEDSIFTNEEFSTKRTLDLENGVESAGDFENMNFPVFHFTPEAITDAGTNPFVNFVMELDSYYFTSENQFYLTHLECFGTTSAHFIDGGSTFNNSDFGLFMTETLSSHLIVAQSQETNVYNESSSFLVLDGESAWDINSTDTWSQCYLDNDIDFTKDPSFLEKAKKGVDDICRKSGYNGTFLYTLKFQKSSSSDYPEVVYKFDELNDTWTVGDAPTKATKTGNYRCVPPYDEETVEVPHVFVDDIYCY